MRKRQSLLSPIALLVAVLLVSGCGGEDEESNSNGPSTENGKPVEKESGPVGILSEAKQQHIWDVEHLAFELETHFGRPFMASLAAEHRDELAAHFLDSFEGRRLKRGGTSLEHRLLRDERNDAESGVGEPLDSDAFVDSLLADRAVFESVGRTRLRVLKLDRDVDDDDVWSARLLLLVSGQTAAGSRLHESRHNVQFVFKQDKDIGSVPIIATWIESESSVRSTDSAQPLFEEITTQAGLADLKLVDNWKIGSELTQQYWRQMAVEDFDQDGFLDIAVASFLGRPLLLRSIKGERFEDVAEEKGLKSWAVDDQHLVNLAVWIDYDNDGFPDLLMGDRLYHNDAGRSFSDVTAESGLFVDHHPMGGVVADYDCDGLLDLYLLYQVPVTEGDSSEPAPWVGDSETGALNHLWHNEGDGKFLNATRQSRAGGGRRKSFAAVWHFLDDDRFPDLYIANDFGSNVHLRNKGDGTFEDVSAETGTADFATSMGVASGDIDNDGSPELYVANMYSKMGRRIIAHCSSDDYGEGVFSQIKGSCAGNRLYRTSPGQSRFDEVSVPLRVNEVGWAYAPVFADFDGDGWLDIYATTGFMSFDRHKPDG